MRSSPKWPPNLTLIFGACGPKRRRFRRALAARSATALGVQKAPMREKQNFQRHACRHHETEKGVEDGARGGVEVLRIHRSALADIQG